MCREEFLTVGPAQFVWQTYYRGELISIDDIVWHVHVLRMFTEREQEELMNNTFH